MTPRTVLFLCTANSCRSQMAEAIVNARYSDLEWRAFSAGTQPTGFVHPLALRVLAESGLAHEGRSKHADEFRNQTFDIVVTLCDDANESCPSGSARDAKSTSASATPPKRQERSRKC